MAIDDMSTRDQGDSQVGCCLLNGRLWSTVGPKIEFSRRNYHVTPNTIDIFPRFGPSSPRRFSKPRLKMWWERLCGIYASSFIFFFGCVCVYSRLHRAKGHHQIINLMVYPERRFLAGKIFKIEF